MPTIGELLLFAVLAFPVWGWILVILAHRHWKTIAEETHEEALEKNRSRVIAIGTLVFWILNLALFDIVAGILLYGATMLTNTTLVQHWQWFWPWGHWLALALAIGNLISIWTHGWEPEPTDDTTGFLSLSYVVAVVVCLIIGGLTLASMIAGALGSILP